MSAPENLTSENAMSEKSENVVWHHGTVGRDSRWAAGGLWGATVWFTGLSGSGKSTIADLVAASLVADGIACYVLDGDNLRHGLNADLGFSAKDRAENVRRVGEVCRLLADAGVVALAPLISPYRSDRDRVRTLHEADGLTFVEVFVDVPLAVCEERDPKGLYARARAGEVRDMTGVDAPYEAPVSPDVRISPDMGDAPALAAMVADHLRYLRTP